MFCDITNSLETNAVAIFSIERCEVEFLMTEKSLRILRI